MILCLSLELSCLSFKNQLTWSSGDPLTVHSRRAEMPCFHRILGSNFLTNTGGSEKIQFRVNQLYAARKLTELKNMHAKKKKKRSGRRNILHHPQMTKTSLTFISWTKQSKLSSNILPFTITIEEQLLLPASFVAEQT